MRRSGAAGIRCSFGADSPGLSVHSRYARDPFAAALDGCLNSRMFPSLSMKLKTIAEVIPSLDVKSVI